MKDFAFSILHSTVRYDIPAEIFSWIADMYYYMSTSVCSKAEELEKKSKRLQSLNMEEESMNIPTAQASGFHLDFLFDNVSLHISQMGLNLL
jgi:hypothetical protein